MLKPDPALRNGYKDKAHLAMVAKLPCLICLLTKAKQKTRTTVHHYHGGGLGLKASDLRVMPLCDSHHQNGQFAFHKIGRIAFEEKFTSQEELIYITNKILNNETVRELLQSDRRFDKIILQEVLQGFLQLPS